MTPKVNPSTSAELPAEKANLIQHLMDTYELRRNQAEYVLRRAELGGNTAQAWRETHVENPGNGYRANQNPKVDAAYRSLLQEHDETRSETFRLTKAKVTEDLELAKIVSLDSMTSEKPAGGAHQAYVRACELQGRAMGMFAQIHKHEHEHSIIPADVLLERLRISNPTLADSLGRHLGVDAIPGECTEIGNESATSE